MHLVVEPLLTEVRACLFQLVESGSPQAVLVLLRYVRHILHPSTYCSKCGRKVKARYTPLISFRVDPILDEDAKPFEPAHVGCVYCDPFFLGLNKKEKVFYIV